MESALHVYWETLTPAANPIKNHIVISAEQTTPDQKNGERNAQPTTNNAANVEIGATLEKYAKARTKNKLWQQKKIKKKNPMPLRKKFSATYG